MQNMKLLTQVVFGVWLGMFVMLPLSVAAEKAPASKPAPAEKLYHEALRPNFHFTARYFDDYRLNPGPRQEGWINDVNGLVYFDGEYHLFGQRWWECWLHAVSKDLIHWTELKPAFGIDKQFGGTQSGSCVIDYNNTSGLATGKTPVMVAFWAAQDNKRQCVSYSNDHGRTWTKYEKNPVLAHGERDPKVFWHEPTKQWIMVLYGPPGNQYLIFTSKNLLNWEKQSAIPDMYECPDMFPLPLDNDPKQMKWVVIAG
ncbi:MAG: glycoside hydrolase family 32 protein, partial [Planctomycetia bacterium]|nr:glycoside hydrolase family 32 protein [Planctomycetia bacterium]